LRSYIFGLLLAPWLPHRHFICPWLQKISANDWKDNCKCVNYFTYIWIVDNQRKQQGTTWKLSENISWIYLQVGSARNPRDIFAEALKYICINRKWFFRGNLANFCKSKKCIIVNVDYRPGLKKSKFDMTLIGHSPFKA
jgi:hypothetical protein